MIQPQHLGLFILSTVAFLNLFLLIFNMKLKKQFKELMVFILILIIFLNGIIVRRISYNLFSINNMALLFCIFTALYREFYNTGWQVFKYHKDLLILGIIFIAIFLFNVVGIIVPGLSRITNLSVTVFHLICLGGFIIGFFNHCNTYAYKIGTLINVKFALFILVFSLLIMDFAFHTDFMSQFDSTGNPSIIYGFFRSFGGLVYLATAVLVFFNVYQTEMEISVQLVDLNKSKENESKIIANIQDLVIQSEEFDSTIYNILRMVIDLTKSDGAVIYLYDKDNDEFVANRVLEYIIPPFVVNSKMLEDNEMLHKKILGTRMSADTPLFKMIADSKDIVSIKKDPNDKSRACLKYLREYESHLDSILGGGILLDDELYGMIIVQKIYAEYSVVDINFFKAICSFSGVIIKNIQAKAKEKETERLANEMKIAEKIQTGILPRHYAVKGYDVCAFMKPAEEVGGDYYDIIDAPDGNFWVNIGDVTGHGVTAGLIMMMLQTSSAALINAKPEVLPDELVVNCNKVIFNNVQERLLLDQFITTCFFKFDKEGKFQYAGAHEDILVYRYATRHVEVIKTSGIWLGLMDDIGHGTVLNDFNLYPGDVLLIYTDGVIEIQKKDGEQYDVQRLVEFLKNHGDKPPTEISEKLYQELDEFKYEQKDDITYVIIKKEQ